MFNKISKVKSFFLILILKLIGIKIDISSYVKNFPHLKINGKTKNIFIGKNVQILGKIDLRNRENGKITIQDNVSIEGECRFVAAREGEIVIGENTIIAAKSAVFESIKPNSFVSGIPAKLHKNRLRQEVVINQLPDLLNRIRNLEKNHNKEI